MLTKLKPGREIGADAVLSVIRKPDDYAAAEAEYVRLRDEQQALRDEQTKATRVMLRDPENRDVEREVRRLVREVEALNGPMNEARAKRNALREPYARSIAEALAPATRKAAAELVATIAGFRATMATLAAIAEVNSSVTGDVMQQSVEGALYALPHLNLLDLQTLENLARRLLGEAIYA